MTPESPPILQSLASFPAGSAAAPDWPRLLRESYAALPAGYAAGGFELLLTSQADAANRGLAAWYATYRSKAGAPALQFALRGATVRRIP